MIPMIVMIRYIYFNQKKLKYIYYNILYHILHLYIICIYKIMDSYYDILEIKKNASDNDIKKAYKKLAMKWHPDKAPSGKEDEYTTKFKDIQEAYSILNDPEKRKLYDKYGKNIPPEQQFQNDPFADLFPNGPHGHHGPFSGLFPNQSNHPHQDHMPTIQVKVKLTLEQIYTGTIINKNIDRFDLCTKCNASGFSDGVSHTCSKCNGKGSRIKMMQLGPNIMTQQQIRCDDCNGSGCDNNIAKCTICNGKKLITSTYSLKINIPPGVHNQQQILIKNEGHEILKDNNNNGQTRGNIVVFVFEKKHNVFSRNVNINNKIDFSNISMVVNITLCESLCGFVKEFKHLDGNIYPIVNESCVKESELKLILNKGMPILNKPNLFGHLIINFQITYPTNLSHEQQTQIFKILTNKDYVDLPFDKPNALTIVNANDIKFNNHNDDPDNNPNAERVECVHQ
jgi:DnaJ family protein A protein 2